MKKLILIISLIVFLIFITEILSFFKVQEKIEIQKIEVPKAELIISHINYDDDSEPLAYAPQLSEISKKVTPDEASNTALINTNYWMEKNGYQWFSDLQGFNVDISHPYWGYSAELLKELALNDDGIAAVLYAVKIAEEDIVTATLWLEKTYVDHDFSVIMPMLAQTYNELAYESLQDDVEQKTLLQYAKKLGYEEEGSVTQFFTEKAQSWLALGEQMQDPLSMQLIFQNGIISEPQSGDALHQKIISSRMYNGRVLAEEILEVPSYDDIMLAKRVQKNSLEIVEQNDDDIIIDLSD